MGTHTRPNRDIRRAAAFSGVCLWQIADSALRDCIASDEVQSLHDAVEALRTINKEIRAAVSVLDTNAAGK